MADSESNGQKWFLGLGVAAWDKTKSILNQTNRILQFSFDTAIDRDVAENGKTADFPSDHRPFIANRLLQLSADKAIRGYTEENSGEFSFKSDRRPIDAARLLQLELDVQFC